MRAPSTPQTLDVRSLGQTRESVAVHNGGLFPVVAVTLDGIVVAVLRGGAGHLGLDGRLELIRSHDAGRTWSAPLVVADSERDDRNPAIGVSHQGTLILAYHRQGSYDAEGVYRPERFAPREAIEVMLTRSHDAGLTWEQPTPLAIDALRFGTPYGKVVTLDDGTLLLPIYLYDDVAEDDGATRANDRPRERMRQGSYLVRSVDDGRTWAEPSLIGAGTNETALLALPDGNLLAAMRGSDTEAALWSTRSADGGRTWSTPVRATSSRQHPGDLLLLANGDVVLTYGNRNPPYRIEGRLSRDGGRTWLDGLVTWSAPLYGADLDAPRPTDLGYPSSVIRRANGTGQGVTLYYVNPSAARVDVDRTHGPRSRFYRESGYRAVAVTWDEAELLAAMSERFG